MRDIFVMEAKMTISLKTKIMHRTCVYGKNTSIFLFMVSLFQETILQGGWMVEQEMQLPKAPSKKKAPKL